VPLATSYGALLDALRGVTWPSRRAVRGSASGTHRSRLRGVSPEFTEYRPYRQGDDPTRIDWKLLARTDRAYIRITSDRSTLATAILLDASASMAYPPETLAKWTQACRIAVGLLAVAHAAGDPAGLLVPALEGVRELAPRTRRGVIAEGARLLERVHPGGDPALAPALALARRAHRVAIVSDFLGDADALLRAARERIIAGVELFAIHVVAREELEPSRDAFLATDPERPEVKRALADATREEYARAYEEWRGELARAWRAAGATFVEVITDEPAEHAVRRIAAPPLASAERA
jgi:uncharacterized protein (DUF58 family)